MTFLKSLSRASDPVALYELRTKTTTNTVRKAVFCPKILLSGDTVSFGTSLRSQDDVGVIIAERKPKSKSKTKKTVITTDISINFGFSLGHLIDITSIY